MQQLFYELRNLPSHPPSTLAADISRHLQTRQYLGTALIICDNPTALLSAVRKQWLKATRSLQRLRASTLNAEEILRLTHVLMHMNNLLFVARSPADYPDASAFFVTPDQSAVTPSGCHTVYITTRLSKKEYRHLVEKLPSHCLLVVHTLDFDLHAYPLTAKSVLEQEVFSEWKKITAFLKRRAIDPDGLVAGNQLQFNAMDQALDILLDASTEFLREAAALQHAINLSQPLSVIPHEQQKKFEAVTRLAHRVQALTPGNFNKFLSVTFSDIASEMFFLREIGSQLYSDLEADSARTMHSQLL